jgi:hypothetical protein
MTSPDRSLIDRSTVACLGGGWHAAMAISPDGSTWPWLISPDPDADAATTPVAFPEHELLGPLPQVVRYRLTRHLCGHPCKDGHPCRREVHARGRLCPQHLTASQARLAPDEIHAHADELLAILRAARDRREAAS